MEKKYTERNGTEKTLPKRRTWQIYSVCMAFFLIFTAVFLGGCQPRTVKIAVAKEMDMPFSLPVNTLLQSEQKAMVTPPVTARVDKFSVKVGQMVKAGDVLVVLNDASIQEQISQLEEAISSIRSGNAPTVIPSIQRGEDNSLRVHQSYATKKVTDRMIGQAKQLLQSGVITKKEYGNLLDRAHRVENSLPSGDGGTNENARGGDYGNSSSGVANSQEDIAVLEDNIKALKQALSQHMIKAPISGRVSAIFNKNQKVLIGGLPFMVIQKEGPLEGLLLVPVALKGPQLAVHVHYDKHDYVGQVQSIRYDKKEANVSFVKVRFPNENNGLIGGLFYNVWVQSPIHMKALVVPISAVRQKDDDHIVYVVDEDGSVDVRSVEVGATEKGYQVILDGLQVGDKVILTPEDYELGEKVRIST